MHPSLRARGRTDGRARAEGLLSHNINLYLHDDDVDDDLRDDDDDVDADHRHLHFEREMSSDAWEPRPDSAKSLK